jgi:hypothetical protein
MQAQLVDISSLFDSSLSPPSLTRGLTLRRVLFLSLHSVPTDPELCRCWSATRSVPPNCSVTSSRSTPARPSARRSLHRRRRGTYVRPLSHSARPARPRLVQEGGRNRISQQEGSVPISRPPSAHGPSPRCTPHQVDDCRSWRAEEEEQEQGAGGRVLHQRRGRAATVRLRVRQRPGQQQRRPRPKQRGGRADPVQVHRPRNESMAIGTSRAPFPCYTHPPSLQNLTTGSFLSPFTRTTGSSRTETGSIWSLRSPSSPVGRARTILLGLRLRIPGRAGANARRPMSIRTRRPVRYPLKPLSLLSFPFVTSKIA